MLIKRFLYNMMMKLIVFLRKDMDLPRQRIIFQNTLRKSVKGMDRDQLGQLIRFNGHFLDKTTKCVNAGEGRGQARAKLLENALNEWKSREYPLGPDKLWAQRILDRYKNWSDGNNCMLEPCQEPQKTVSSNIFEVIKNRKSIRFWKDIPVERKDITNLIRAATHAPSSCNRMPWRFFIVENDSKRVIQGDSTNESLLTKAPVRIYIAIDERLYPEIYAPALDAGIALQNLLLTAQASGLGACALYQCESVDQKNLKQALQIPEYYRIYCVVVLGYPGEDPAPPARVKAEEVCDFIKAPPNLESFLPHF